MTGTWKKAIAYLTGNGFLAYILLQTSFRFFYPVYISIASVHKILLVAGEWKYTGFLLVQIIVDFGVNSIVGLSMDLDSGKTMYYVVKIIKILCQGFHSWCMVCNPPTSISNCHDLKKWNLWLKMNLFSDAKFKWLLKLRSYMWIIPFLAKTNCYPGHWFCSCFWHQSFFNVRPREIIGLPRKLLFKQFWIWNSIPLQLHKRLWLWDSRSVASFHQLLAFF